MSRPRHFVASARALALAFALATTATSARPALADAATAQALFDAAKQLMAQGKYAEACPKLEESQRLDPGLGTQFNLASCYEKLGRNATAWSLYLEVAGAAKASNQLDREKVARQRANALEPQLVRLTVSAPSDAPDSLVVRRDGAPIGRAQWGTPVPIDPGTHTVEAFAPGMRPFTTTVEINKPGDTKTVEVPRLERAAAPLAATGPAQPLYAVPLPPPPPSAAVQHPQMKRRSTAMMVTGIVLMSAGTLSGLVGSAVIAGCSNDSSGTCSVRPGVAMLGIGIVGLGVGLPLTIVGARKVPVLPARDKASLAPTMLLSPTSAALRWTW